MSKHWLTSSEDEARMMVYKIHINSTNTEYGFGTLLSQDIFHRVEALPRVFTILPDDPSPNSKIIDQMPLPRSVRKFR
ncbi:multiple organellar RNA editing factor 8, chloroplastic/mitochondrial-like isoform X2 [Vicia villosa]|uniref:multiple organellar RNA editing factor 8, chloroplastic/mitochondrial-like isoform X2 n=1 Tax=Vicia villosa TaxID=3911 RepID=UPI00273CD118|nr:multiple organellar RNA editing factor 8, chloroplastic/mitochondrial-like isoform X2 [Vicia villosa]